MPWHLHLPSRVIVTIPQSTQGPMGLCLGMRASFFFLWALADTPMPRIRARHIPCKRSQPTCLGQIQSSLSLLWAPAPPTPFSLPRKLKLVVETATDGVSSSLDKKQLAPKRGLHGWEHYWFSKYQEILPLSLCWATGASTINSPSHQGYKGLWIHGKMMCFLLSLCSWLLHPILPTCSDF